MEDKVKGTLRVVECKIKIAVERDIGVRINEEGKA